MEALRFVVGETVSVPGKGVVLAGRLEAGIVRVGERLRLEGAAGTFLFTVGGIEVRGEPGLMEIAASLRDIGLLARGISAGLIELPAIVTDAGTGRVATVWPPAPAAPPAGVGDPPRRRTMTPSVWLDALLGLPAGAALFYLVGQVVQALEHDPKPGEQLAQAYVVLGIVAAACAPVCLVIGRRFPVLAALTALGAAGAIVGDLLLIPWWLERSVY